MIATTEEIDYSQFDYQEHIFHQVPEDVHFTVVPKGRRGGITHGGVKACLKWCLKYHMKVGCKILWVDTIYTNIMNYYEIYFYPELKKIDKRFWNFNKKEMVLKLFNSRIVFKSAETNSNIEGDGFDYIILNETGIILKGKKGRLLWNESILPMLMDFNGQVFFIGTPKGENTTKDDIDAQTGKRHKECCYAELIHKGEDPDEEAWRTIYIETRDNPQLTKKMIDEVEKGTPPHLRDQQLRGRLVKVNHDNILKRNWMNVIEQLPDQSLWGRLLISGDTAYTEKECNDESAFVLILETDIGYFILDCFHGRYEIGKLCKELKKFYDKNDCRFYNKNITLTIVENKASGPPLVQTIKSQTNIAIKTVDKGDGIVGDKVSRVNSIAPLFETDKVYFLYGAWNADVINQLTQFNEAMDTDDDIVDAVSQGLIYLKQKGRSDITKVKSARVKRTSKVLKGFA